MYSRTLDFNLSKFIFNSVVGRSSDVAAMMGELNKSQSNTFFVNHMNPKSHNKRYFHWLKQIYRFVVDGNRQLLPDVCLGFIHKYNKFATSPQLSAL